MQKKRMYRLVILLGILLIFSSCNLKDKDDKQNTKEQQDLLNELNSVIIPIQGSSPNLDDKELAPLDFLKQAKIVGLGEATHGTKEFFEMKHRIFKYLVEHHGFKAFAFESDFSECIYIDRYITGGEGDLDDLMRNTMIFWTWCTAEVRALLAWMREYNEGKEKKDMIRYFGVDCQFFRYKADLLVEYLGKVSPETLQECESTLDKTRDLDKWWNQQNISNEELDEIEEGLQYLYEQFEKKENEFVSLSSKEDYEITKHIVRVLLQVKEVAFQGGSRSRDKYMAENALWVLNLLGKNKKIALWAHNGHVENTQNWMGKYLKDELGKFYQVVGFSFSRGGLVAKKISAAGVSGGLFIHQVYGTQNTSINSLFHDAKYDNFIFKLDTLLLGTKLSDWLSEPRMFLRIGAAYNPENPNAYYSTPVLTTAYDVLIHFDEVLVAENYRY
ncbi:erythromycin esterase family protein [Acidobacteriota bacterium]